MPAEVKAPAAAKVKLTKNQQTMFAILVNAKRLTTDEWNEQAREAGIGVARRADLFDIKDALKDKKLVTQLGEQWTVRHEG